MRQVVVRRGRVLAEEVPAPCVSDGCVLVQVHYSCISAGTEVTSVKGSGTSLVRRAIERPEKILKLASRLGQRGLKAVVHEVRVDQDASVALGYSAAGVVLATGKGVTGFSPGDRVAVAGGGHANHAEFVDVPVNLAVTLPRDADLASASSVALGAIALQGVRRAGLTLGEVAVVVGTGILGLLTVQLLRRSGVRVIALDIDSERLRVAEELGAEKVVDPSRDDAVRVIQNITDGHGADAVLFTAATDSSEPLSRSFQACRRKGRVVLVGVSGMQINRDDIYAKELDLLVSTSYGPGRYDHAYEDKGLDYPFAYVRWTEQRNMAEYLRMLYRQEIRLEPLVQGTYPVEEAAAAFHALQAARPRPLLLLLRYPGSDAPQRSATSDLSPSSAARPLAQGDRVAVAVVGTGSFARNVLLPNLKRRAAQFHVRTVMSRRGIIAADVARQYGEPAVAGSYEEILNDPGIDLVMICTRHHDHADLALRGLSAGKAVFVEKPLCVTSGELASLRDFYESDGQAEKPLLMVGYNRRFSPYVREIKRAVSGRVNPLYIVYRMNAGFMPADHWVHEDGGRIVGEACHIVDLMTYLTGARVVEVTRTALSPTTARFSEADNQTLLLKYDDGSLATIHYLAVGNAGVAKEYMEVHWDGRSIVLDDYRTMAGHGVRLPAMATKISEKGHAEELDALYAALTSRDHCPPIALWDLFQTSAVTLLPLHE